MAVEDHPKWREWLAAFDELAEAMGVCRGLEGRPAGDEAFQAARAWQRKALATYEKVSAELD